MPAGRERTPITSGRQGALWRLPPGRKIRDDAVDEPLGPPPADDMPLQPTSRREWILRPGLDHPWLPEQDAANRRSRQEGPEDYRLNAEEQQRDGRTAASTATITSPPSWTSTPPIPLPSPDTASAATLRRFQVHPNLRVDHRRRTCHSTPSGATILLVPV